MRLLDGVACVIGGDIRPTIILPSSWNLVQRPSASRRSAPPTRRRPSLALVPEKPRSRIAGAGLSLHQMASPSLMLWRLSCRRPFFALAATPVQAFCTWEITVRFAALRGPTSRVAPGAGFRNGTQSCAAHRRMASSRSLRTGPDASGCVVSSVHKKRGADCSAPPRESFRRRRCPGSASRRARYGPEASAPNPPRSVPSFPRPSSCAVHMPITPIGPSMVLPTNLPVSVPPSRGTSPKVRLA